MKEKAHKLTFTPGMLTCPEATLLPSLDSEIQVTSFVWPSKNDSFPEETFLITTKEPNGYTR